jgi:hypothetical protein
MTTTARQYDYEVNVSEGSSNDEDQLPLYLIYVSAESGFYEPVNTVCMFWRGTDIEALSRKYPPSDTPGADPLYLLDSADGFTRYTTTFLRLVQGTYQPCDDPRHRSTSVAEAC